MTIEKGAQLNGEAVDAVTEHIYAVVRTMNGQTYPNGSQAGEAQAGHAENAPIDDACFDRATVEALVGDVTLPPDHDPNEYDERVEIIRDAVGAIQRMREKNLALAKALGIEISDDELAAWRPNETETAQLRKELASQRKRCAMVRGVETYIDDQVMLAAEEGIRLRPHQQDVAVGTRNFVINAPRTTSKGGKSGLVEQPTGTGKTRVMVETVAMLKHDEDPDEPVKVLVLTPTNRIQKQTVGRDGKRGFGKFAPDMDVGQYDESIRDRDRSDELSKEVVVMCVPSFLNLLEKGELPDFDAILVDEAHTVLGERTSKRLVEYGEDKIMVGVTATPDYDDNDDPDAEARRTAYKIFHHKIAEMQLAEAVYGGLLAPVAGHLQHVSAKINSSTLPTDPRERREAIRAAHMQAKEDKVIEIVKEELARGYAEVPGDEGIGIVIRCKPGGDIEQAVRVATRLRGMYVQGPNGPLDLRPIMPAFVGGTTRRQRRGVREQVFEAAEGRKINVITQVKAIGMGYDNDHTKVVINLDALRRPAGKVESAQTNGRALRLMRDAQGNIIRSKIDGKPIRAHLYDFADDELGDGQYHVLHLLGAKKSGDVIEADPRSDAPIPRPRTMRRGQERYVRPAEVMDVVMTTIGTAALDGGVDLDIQTAAALEVEQVADKAPSDPTLETNPLAPSGWPNQSGLAEFRNAFGGDMEIPQAEAARLLGVGSSTLKGLLNTLFGSSQHTPTLDDVTHILDKYPLLSAPPAPESGYAEVSRKDTALRSYARAQGIPLHRFTKADGTVSYYLTDENIHVLLSRKNAENSK